METNCDNTQFEESENAEASGELQAESCSSCGNGWSDDIRSGMWNDNDGRSGRGRGMRPCGDRPCGDRPCGNRPGNDRPCDDRPCGNRPGGVRPGSGRPGGMRPCGPGNGRPCGGRPGMRPNMRPGMRPYGDGPRSTEFGDDADLHSEWNCKSRVINTSDGRSMVMGCEGQTMSGCHMNDPMERLGDAFPPVMAFVPWQQWGDLYEPDCGLKQGTIFKDLNYIFCGTRC